MFSLDKQINLHSQKWKIKPWLALSFSTDQRDEDKQPKAAMNECWQPSENAISSKNKQEWGQGKNEANNSNQVRHFLKIYKILLHKIIVSN